MKKLLLIGLICLMGRIGFTQSYAGTTMITILPPSSITHVIHCYCLEYCPAEFVASDTAWEYIHVEPEQSYNILTGCYEYLETTYWLYGLDLNTDYVVRVHAFYREYDENGEYYDFGYYGEQVNFRTSEYEESVSVAVNCGPMSLDGGDWHSIYVVTSLYQELPESTPCRLKEEWEQLT